MERDTLNKYKYEKEHLINDDSGKQISENKSEHLQTKTRSEQEQTETVTF